MGRRFDEDMPSFAHWPSLRHVLADLADALEGGLLFLDRIPLAVAGKLAWEDERTVPAEAVSPVTRAAALAEPESDPPALIRPVFTNMAGSPPPPSEQGGTRTRTPPPCPTRTSPRGPRATGRPMHCASSSDPRVTSEAASPGVYVTLEREGGWRRGP